MSSQTQSESKFTNSCYLSELNLSLNCDFGQIWHFPGCSRYGRKYFSTDCRYESGNICQYFPGGNTFQRAADMNLEIFVNIFLAAADIWGKSVSASRRAQSPGIQQPASTSITSSNYQLIFKISKREDWFSVRHTFESELENLIHMHSGQAALSLQCGNISIIVFWNFEVLLIWFLITTGL